MRTLALVIVLTALFIVSPNHVEAQTITNDTTCNLPGPYSGTECTVGYYVRSNPSGNIICLWSGTALRACEGVTNFGGSYEHVGAGGATLDFVRHTVFPTSDPDWPNAAVVKAKGTLVTSRSVSATSFNAPGGACDITVAVGGNIQTALNTGNDVICLASGVHTTSADVSLLANQTLRAASGVATIRRNVPGVSSRVVVITQSNGFLKDLVIEGTSTDRAEYGVLVYNTSNVLMENVSVNYSIHGVGINLSSNVEFRNGAVNYAGDQVACSGCAQPSMWIHQSSNVRVAGSTFISNGVGPEGDGEVACHHSSNVTIHSSSVQDIGSGGIYLVDCDYARILNNDVEGSREWGLDIVDLSSNGSDYGLFQDNYVADSKNGGVVLKNSKYAVFVLNSYVNNRTGPSASGSCNGVNKRNTTTGFFQVADTSSPSGVSCND